MSTILEALKGINAYPIPLRTLDEVAERRGLDLRAEATKETMTGAGYNLALADLLMWLSFAPGITQGGQSFSFTDEQRLQLRNKARSLYDEFGTEDEAFVPKTVYGYKGSRL